MIEAFPNDPIVTGVSEVQFPLPVHLDFDAAFGSILFQDRFEEALALAGASVMSPSMKETVIDLL